MPKYFKDIISATFSAGFDSSMALMSMAAKASCVRSSVQLQLRVKEQNSSEFADTTEGCRHASIQVPIRESGCREGTRRQWRCLQLVVAGALASTADLVAAACASSCFLLDLLVQPLHKAHYSFW